MKPITVLIVDDSALIRTMFKEMLSSVSDIQVLDTAVDPLDAREKIKRLNPDVVTLDIEMPNMNGIAFLEKIMALRPMPVLMVSTLTQKGAAETIRALELGAVDYISKPTGAQTRDALSALKEDLIAKVREAAKANLRARTSAHEEKNVLLSYNGDANAHLIAIGSSTGGVETLRDIFGQLPANCPPIVMTQHMPPSFTTSFAARLDSISAVSVKEAEEGDKLKPGHAYLARGGRHLSIIRSGTDFICHLEDGAAGSGHRPSVDVLFNSVAEVAALRAVGVILTGMGKDGAQGLLKMRQSGSRTIGQNKNSCVVYGMPKAAYSIGAVEEELALADIPARILSLCEKERKVRHAAGAE